MAKKAKAKRIQSDITLDALLADGWIKTSDPVSPLKKEIINRNPLSAREDSDIKLVVHGMYNDQTFAVLLPDGGMLNFNPGSMAELQAFEKAIMFYDPPF
jgi:hypothetical protein